METKKYCFALDLQPDEKLIQEYEEYHRKVWPEIIESIKASGIERMEIYRVKDRLFMIMETNETFSLEKKALLDANNPIVQEWEALMWRYQQALPGAEPGEKWMLMQEIFSL